MFSLLKFYKIIFYYTVSSVEGGMAGSKQQNEKFRDFYDQKIIGYKNYGVKILQMAFF